MNNMKIDSSMVVLSSDHRLESQHTRAEKLEIWVDTPRREVAADRVTISGKAKEISLTEPCGSPRKRRGEPVEGTPSFS